MPEREDVISMRKYKGNYLTAVVCNCCGRNLVVANGIVREGVVHICAEWDYFSEKDGENHKFDICEECYDRLLAGFRYPAMISQRTELL